jgi:hypothetical protein
MRGAEKISTSHLDRIALIYILLSSLAQVRENTESTARQYGLVTRRVRLGYPPSSVEVIDADLGLPGRSADKRTGFQDLVGRVGLGEVHTEHWQFLRLKRTQRRGTMRPGITRPSGGRRR